jgi:hypothetical protein
MAAGTLPVTGAVTMRAATMRAATTAGIMVIYAGRGRHGHYAAGGHLGGRGNRFAGAHQFRGKGGASRNAFGHQAAWSDFLFVRQSEPDMDLEKTAGPACWPGPFNATRRAVIRPKRFSSWAAARWLRAASLAVPFLEIRCALGFPPVTSCVAYCQNPSRSSSPREVASVGRVHRGPRQSGPQQTECDDNGNDYDHDVDWHCCAPAIFRSMVIECVRSALISIKRLLSRVGRDTFPSPLRRFGAGRQFVRNQTPGRLDATAKRNPIN